MSKFKGLYHMIRILASSIPYSLRDELYTELLIKGLKLQDMPEPYVYTALKNHKKDFLRSKRSKDPVVRAEELLPNECIFTEEDKRDYRLERLYLCYLSLPRIKQLFLEDLIWKLHKHNVLSVRRSSKSVHISPTTGYSILKQLRKEINDVETEETESKAIRIRDIDRLYTLVFPSGRRRRGPRMP